LFQVGSEETLGVVSMLERLEKSLSGLDKRMEDHMDRHMKAIIEKSLSGLEKRMEDRMDRHMEAIIARLDRRPREVSRERPRFNSGDKDAVERRMEAVDARLTTIADHLGIATQTDIGDDDEDRKRLKEKLKAALNSQQNRDKRHETVEKESWMEYIFGICKPDGRVGKKGSR
jgi:hypothetical protein